MINNIVLIGRLTADPILKTTTSAKYVTTFTLAVVRDYQKDITDFITVVAWEGRASFVANNFSKGDMIAVVGSLQSRKYTDKKGKVRSAYEVIAESVSFCGEKRKTEETDWQNYLPDAGGFRTPGTTAEDFAEVYYEET